MISKRTPARWKALTHTKSRYTIERLIDEEPAPFPLDSAVNVTTLVFKWLLWALYLVCRYRVLLGFHYHSSTTTNAVWLILLMEICALLPPFLSQLDLSLYIIFGRKDWRRPRYRLVGDRAPTIDVFVTCCGESVDMIMNTVFATASQDYPHDKYQVFVLDDAGDSNLEREIALYNNVRKQSKEAVKVSYLARTKFPAKPHFFKAGNLQFGLTKSTRDGFISEYIAALDVDAIMQSDWLRRIIPHLILDSKLALVNPAQGHYNLPDDDILCQDSASSGMWSECMRDDLGLSTCYGSGYILRRQALDEVGGWPQVPIGEDIFFGFQLAGLGWGIGFCRDILQSDLTPESFDSLVKQRMRWVEGDLNLVRRFNFFLPGFDPSPQRTFIQRVSVIINSVRLYRAVTDAIFLLLTPIFLFTLQLSQIEKDQKSNDNSSVVNKVLLASILVGKLNSFLAFGHLNGITNSELWITPYKAMSVVHFFLPNASLSFTPTNTVVSAVNERSGKYRLPLNDRLQTLPMLAYLGYIASSTIGILHFMYQLFYHWRGGGVVYSTLFTGALVWLLECIFKISVPVRYMIWPPTVPEWRELLEEDNLGVRRPIIKQRGPSSRVSNIPWLDFLQVIVVACFVGYDKYVSS